MVGVPYRELIAKTKTSVIDVDSVYPTEVKGAQEEAEQVEPERERDGDGVHKESTEDDVQTAMVTATGPVPGQPSAPHITRSPYPPPQPNLPLPTPEQRLPLPPASVEWYYSEEMHNSEG